MDGLDDFIKTVDSRFWRHITNRSVLPFKEGEVPSNRTQFLTELYERISKMNYVPLAPRGIIVSAKQRNLVARFIPALNVQDYCVYYYCLKKLENEIAKNRIPGTYGGWQLGGKIRRLEQGDDEPDYAPEYGFNRGQWSKAWGEYQRKAYSLIRAPGITHYLVFDIANFYDTIRFDQLESMIRASVDRKKSSIVDLLFYFLRNSNRKYYSYTNLSVGLPQDEVGDCSRILANLYLQEYDKYVYDLCREKDAKYLRYADDQIIASKNQDVPLEIMFEGSKELTKLGLNLNANKAVIMDSNQFQAYWSFDIHSLIDDGKAKEAFNLFEKRLSEKANFRSLSILKRLLNLPSLKTKPFRDELLNLVLDGNTITNFDGYYLGRIYTLTAKEDRQDFISLLNRLSDKILFNQFHWRVLSFAQSHKIDPKAVKRVERNLKKRNVAEFV